MADLGVSEKIVLFRHPGKKDLSRKEPASVKQMALVKDLTIHHSAGIIEAGLVH